MIQVNYDTNLTVDEAKVFVANCETIKRELAKGKQMGASLDTRYCSLGPGAWDRCGAVLHLADGDEIVSPAALKSLIREMKVEIEQHDAHPFYPHSVLTPAYLKSHRRPPADTDCDIIGIGVAE